MENDAQLCAQPDGAGTCFQLGVRRRGPPVSLIVRRHRTMLRILLLILVCALPSLASCRSLGELASVERTSIQSVVPVGSSFAFAGHKLAGLGCKCERTTGRFFAESGEVASAPSFLWCVKEVPLNVACGVRTQVIVVPEAGTVTQVHVSAHDNCL
jgi:hypothetical protein